MLSALKAYLGAVFGHWLGMVGGSSLIVFLGLWERKVGQNIPWSKFAIVAGVLVLGAMFRAWRDEFEAKTRARLELQAERAARPDLEMFFDPTDPVCFAVDPQKGETRVSVGIMNHGGRHAERAAVVVVNYAGNPAPDWYGEDLVGRTFGTFEHLAPTHHPSTYLLVLTHYSRQPFAARPEDEAYSVLHFGTERLGVTASRLDLILELETEFRCPPLRLRLVLPPKDTPTAESVAMDAPTELTFVARMGARSNRAARS